MDRLRRVESLVRQWVSAGLNVTVVVPCYNVERQILETVRTIPSYVQAVILVNDASEDGTAALIDKLSGGRIHAVHLSRNRGVGGATWVGFARALELGADVIVKMDGDGQMDPADLPLLIEPLVRGKADYAKGNRFRGVSFLSQMPLARRFGNAALSLLTKAASGYWNVFDPANGFVAIRREVLELIPEKMIHARFFFESSMLIALGLLRAMVIDVPMKARYGMEKSKLRISRVVMEFPYHLTIGFLRRFWFTKILYCLTIEAILSLFGILLMGAGVAFGIVEGIHYAILLRTPAPSGTVMTAALPVLLGFQMVLNAIVLDIQSVPNTPLTERMAWDASPSEMRGDP